MGEWRIAGLSAGLSADLFARSFALGLGLGGPWQSFLSSSIDQHGGARVFAPLLKTAHHDKESFSNPPFRGIAPRAHMAAQVIRGSSGEYQQ